MIGDVEDTVIKDQLSVCGIVVDVVKPPDHSRRPYKLAVDDGTGVLDVVFWGNDMPEWAKNIDIGESVLARGTLKLFRNNLQMVAKSLKKVADVNFKTLWINKCLYEKKIREEKPEIFPYVKDPDISAAMERLLL